MVGTDSRTVRQGLTAKLYDRDRQPNCMVGTDSRTV